ncbi:MAG: twin-arginine translocase subunit TatC [Anaerolineales bacterium]|nr:MAG: twin-arginine translocase subunit TatC [Anaerolineales bacterium]
MQKIKNYWRRIFSPFLVIGRFIARPFKRVAEFFQEEPDDAPMVDSLQLAFEEPASFLEHIRALRKHILRAFVVLLICAVAAFLFLPEMLEFISQPIDGMEHLTAVDVTEPIGVGMRIVLLAAFTAALPYIIFEIFLFVAPALTRKTRVIGLFSIPLVVVFFFGGMAFAYYLILPTGLPVLLNFLDVPTQIRPSSYIRFATGLMFWFGALFEFPLLAYLLTVMRFLTPQALIKNWRFAVVVIAVLAAVITPTIDPINMMLVMVPLLLLYGLSILLSLLAGGWRRKKEPGDQVGEEELSKE